MILIADGGSTKVDWCLVDRGVLKKRVFTKGANPFFRTTKEISEDLKQSFVPQLNGEKITAVYFYGAGCAFPEKNEIIRVAIAENFDAEKIEVESDLLGAAIGLCGDNAGIVCILGTGSNSCFYDGQKIVKNVSPLGYILGDEGSGAVLGKLFMGSCLKNQLTEGLKEKLLEYFDLPVSQILDKVYKQPLPNRFLASICPFIMEHLQDKSVRDLVYNAFADFFKKNVMQYDYLNYKVSFVGSVAFYFKDILFEVASDLDITMGLVQQSPMDGLISFFGNQYIRSKVEEGK